MCVNVNVTDNSKLHTFYIEIELKFAYIHGECNFISTYLVIVHFSGRPRVLL